MTLSEAIALRGELDEEATLYAEKREPWSPETACICLPFDEESRGTVRTIDGREWFYFLEVLLIREILEDWEHIVGRPLRSNEEATSVAIYYATNDCWPKP